MIGNFSVISLLTQRAARAYTYIRTSRKVWRGWSCEGNGGKGIGTS